ncbi:hypothetical protein CsSME_00009021 [Camellia sinensis var. sinensis]
MPMPATPSPTSPAHGWSTPTLVSYLLGLGFLTETQISAALRLLILDTIGDDGEGLYSLDRGSPALRTSLRSKLP